MALVKCPDCDHDVSNRAEACPHCGCPAKHFLRRDQPEKVLVFGRWGDEAIEWRVQAEENGRTLLVSKKAIDCRVYNYSMTTGYKWEGCDLRWWLNRVFYQGAFNADERASITELHLHNDDNPVWGTWGGADSFDHVFCLSIEEANRYFKSDGERICYPTKLAQTNRVITNDSGACGWWLRSPGKYGHSAAIVSSDGAVDISGDVINCRYDYGVRPALWLNL